MAKRPVLFYIVFILPVSDCQSGKKCRAHRRCFNALRPDHLRMQNIRLELHQEIVGAGTAIHLQMFDLKAGVLLHGSQYIRRLISQRLYGSANQVLLRRSAG